MRPGASLLYLWDADYPWDVRTEKVCLALAEAGYQVHIVARNRRWSTETESRPEGMVHRMPPWRWLGQRLDGALSFPAFFSPRWYRHLHRTALAYPPVAIIARDLPLCPTAIWVGRRLGVPVLFDMAEVYPALLQDVWDTGRAGRFDWLVRNPRAATMLERYCLPRVARVLTVVEEARDHVLGRGIPEARVDVVSNTPPLARSQGPAAVHRDGPIEAVYMGIMEVARGIEVLLDALAALRGRGRSAHLHLIGGGRDLPLFQQQAARLGLGPADVTFHGFIPSHAEALAIVARCGVGLAPHFANGWANTTIPNKLFDYMAAGVPVIVSDALPMARIVTETGAGLVFRDRDVEGLASCLERLGDPALRTRLGAAGRAAVSARYHWEFDRRVLLDAIARLPGPA